MPFKYGPGAYNLEYSSRLLMIQEHKVLMVQDHMVQNHKSRPEYQKGDLV